MAYKENIFNVYEFQYDISSIYIPVPIYIQFTPSCLTATHRLQHIRLPCPSPTPGACSNSRPSSQWCHPTISFSIVPFSSCLQFFPASVSFPLSQFFASGGQSIGASASASVLPMNITYMYIIAVYKLYITENLRFVNFLLSLLVITACCQKIFAYSKNIKLFHKFGFSFRFMMNFKLMFLYDVK